MQLFLFNNQYIALYIIISYTQLHHQLPMKSALAVVAMVNGMIGGLTLVLPIYVSQTGTILTAIIMIVTGFFSFYSCYLCIIHLGHHSDLDKALYYHFGESMFVKVAYDLLVFLNLLFILLLYFNLIVKQWEGLIAPSLANPLSNAVALFILVVLLKYFHFGAKLMGYGIVSIICFWVFLVWLLASAPPGDNKIPLIGKGGGGLAAAMSQGFAIQIFFIPVLKELPDPTKYVKYTFLAYLFGGLVYFYIAFAGAFGIINRTQVVSPAQTIEDYFHQDQWQVAIIQCIYLVHLYSAFGQFLLVSKKRFFSMLIKFDLTQSKHGQMPKPTQIVYTIVAIGLALGIYFSGISIEQLIQFNGAVIAYFFIYLLPAAMHFKCLYWKRKSNKIYVGQRPTQLLINKNLQLSQRDNSNLARHLVVLVPQKSQSDNIVIKQPQQREQNDKLQPMIANEISGINKEPVAADLNSIQNNHQCLCKKPPEWLQTFDIISLICMLALGTFILVDGLITIIHGNSS